MKNAIRMAAMMGFAAIALNAQQLPPPAGAQPAAAAPAGPSKEEIEAVQKIQSISLQSPADADARMKAADDFVLKYSTSSLRFFALTLAGEAAQAKKDSAKARFYYQNAIKADPEKADYAMIMLGAEIAMTTGEHDLDKKQKLTEAQGYADKALEIINTRAKQPNESDAQFEEAKKEDTARVHMTLGLIRMANQENAEAGKEFILAVDSSPNGDPMNLIRAGMAFNNAKQFDDANKALDRFIALPGIPDQYKKIAQDEKKRGDALKSQK